MSAKPTYEELEKRVQELERALAEQKAGLDRPTGKSRDEAPTSESAGQYRLMVEKANEAILVARDGVIVFSNPRAEAFFGYSKRELGARPFAEFVHEADRKMVSDRHERRLAGDTSIPDVYSFRITHKSGDIRWVKLKVALFSWKNGPAGLCFMTDITEQKQAEDALRRSEARFRLIFEQSTAGIAIASADGRFIDANQAVCDMLGYTREELLRLTVYDVTFPDDRNLSIQTDRLVLKGKQDAFRLEKRYRHKEGRLIWADLSSSVVRDDNGSIRYAISMIVDITERKRAEKALKASEVKFRNAFDTDLVAMAISRPSNGKYLEANPGFQKVTGYAHDEIVGHTPLELGFYSSEERAALMGEIAEKGRLNNRELTFPTKSEGWKTILISLGPIVFDNEYCFLAVMVDITERKKAEEALKKFLAEKEVLLREIHHRVKNNMQAIVGLLRMHARRTDNAQLTEIFNDCQDRIEAMSLVHEALYQSGDLAKIDFEAYLKKLCRNLAQAHDAQGKRIALTANAADVSLNMDQGIAVGMIIAELTSNAFKHAFPDGEGGTVSVHLDRPDGETVRLVVSDTGKGPPPDFDIQNPSSLGMRLVAGAVTRELGGTIDVERDNGTRFIIRFDQRPTRF